MSGTEQADPVEQLVRHHVGTGYLLESGPVWLTVRPEGITLPAHGWKLHLSARVLGFPELIATVLPVLLDAGCAFKLARSLRALSDLNEGISAPAAVGKAVTIYPDQDRVRELGLRLAEVLRGQKGPRILSDRQVRDDAPVYYRYGPFQAGWEADSEGRLVSLLRGPAGEEFDAAATLSYRQPPWSTDPFTGEAGERPPEQTGPTLLGGRYRITDGIRQSARGNVYSAVDEQDGGVVIVKQARALVAEYDDHNDTRLRLRNERRVLRALDGVAGVPKFRDHFRHADDEFLVTSHCGPRTLVQDVLTGGAYPPAAAGPRSLDRLTACLARIVSDVHQRGVIIRDLSPNNIVTDGQTVSVVDFGIAAYAGLHLPGATPGYAPARQLRDEPPRETDDYYALGMTLLFAATMLDPVPGDGDAGLSRRRALQTIQSRYGKAPTGVIAAIADLLSEDSERSTEAFQHLAHGQEPGPHGSARSLPAPPEITPQIAAAVAADLLDKLLDRAAEILRSGSGTEAAHDASIYSGTAGIGLELLQNTHVQRSADLVADLAPFTATAARRVKLLPGLFTGSTGVEVFLRQAVGRGVDLTGSPAGNIPGPGWEPVGDDLIVGAAGIGLGHLSLYRATGDTAHLDMARRCAAYLRARPGPDALHVGAPAPGSAPPGDLAPRAAVDTSSGSAHGLAGKTEFWLALAVETGDEPVLAAAARHADQLARRARVLIREAGNPAVPTLAASWCRGLAGIGGTLLQAGPVLGDASLVSLAREAADICLAYVPRMSVLGRCCGVAGIGCFLIDLATVTGDQCYWPAADDVAAHMLLRSWGAPGHPEFVSDDAHDGRDASWSSGLTGLLTFFRRLAQHGGPDCLPLRPPTASPTAISTSLLR